LATVTQGAGEREAAGAPGRDSDRMWFAAGLFVSLSAAIVVAHYYALSQVPELHRLARRWLAIAALANSERELWLAAGICAPLALLLRDGSRPVRIAAGVAAAVAALAVAVLNFSAAELLRTFGSLPSVGLLIYSDILFSSTGRAALFSWIPRQLGWCILAAAAVSAVSLGLAAKLRRRVRWDIALAAAIALALLGSHVLQRWSLGDHDYRRSPTLAFLKSFQMLRENRLLERGAHWVPPPPGPWEAGATIDRQRASKMRNVILLVIESGSAAYFDQYGGPYHVTPTLSALPGSLQVDHAYAQAVSSTHSLGVLLSSTYPAVALEWQVPTAETLPHLLQRHGWQTGFFYSTDARYEDADRLLDHTGFDVVHDFRSRRCADAQIEDISEFNSQATSDACTFADAEGWIGRVAAKPFFAMIWTYQTHYPYFTTGRARPVVLGHELDSDPSAKEMKARYLTALRETDDQIRRLVTFLDRRGLSDSTLIVITGDHGEAFKQHGTLGHGHDLYEESVHVPLLVAGPRLSAARHLGRLTGHIDIAPTIADVLGIDAPAAWVGSSLFRPRRSRPVYFSSPWTDLMVGYRLGQQKVIGRLMARSVARYDLARDPGERANLAARDRAWRDAELDALAGWARSVRPKS
jgi:lipoteichoic acid synthase